MILMVYHTWVLVNFKVPKKIAVVWQSDYSVSSISISQRKRQIELTLLGRGGLIQPALFSDGYFSMK